MLFRVLLIVAVALTLIGILAYHQWYEPPAVVSGVVEAHEIRLGSQVGGRVERVAAQEGDQVVAGQMLIALEPFDLHARRAEVAAQHDAARIEHARLAAGYRAEELAQARAQHDQLAAKLDKLKAGPRPQEITAAEARLEQAQAAKSLADRNFERVSQLVERGASTAEEMDRNTQIRDAAASNVIVREQELAILQEGSRAEDIREAAAQLAEAVELVKLRESGFRAEDIAKAKAEMEAAAAALAAIDRQLEELVIKAPVDGVIESLELQPGELVSAGAPVLSMLDTSAMWIRAYVPVNRMAVRPGQKVRVTIDNLPDQSVEGVVAFISRQAEFTPSNAQTFDERAKEVFRIKVQLPANLAGLRPGMAGDVYLDVSERE